MIGFQYHLKHDHFRYGRPGVEFYGEHDSEQKVTKIAFLPGQGRLVTLTEDNFLHLWEINQSSMKVYTMFAESCNFNNFLKCQIGITNKQLIP